MAGHPASRTASSSSRQRRFPVSELQVSTISGMFPHIPRDAISDDLAYTGNTEASIENILAGRIVLVRHFVFKSKRGTICGIVDHCVYFIEFVGSEAFPLMIRPLVSLKILTPPPNSARLHPHNNPTRPPARPSPTTLTSPLPPTKYGKTRPPTVRRTYDNGKNGCLNKLEINSSILKSKILKFAVSYRRHTLMA